VFGTVPRFLQIEQRHDLAFHQVRQDRPPTRSGLLAKWGRLRRDEKLEEAARGRVIDGVEEPPAATAAGGLFIISHQRVWDFTGLSESIGLTISGVKSTSVSISSATSWVFGEPVAFGAASVEESGISGTDE
jgi:hypothetical protein